MTNNIFDMLQVMCDAAILIADDNWGDRNVSEYVQSRIPNCQHVEGFRDILHPVIAKRKEAVNNGQQSSDRIDCAFNLFKKRDKKALCEMRGDIHTELQDIHCNVYELTLNSKAAKILEKSEEYDRLEKEISSKYTTKLELEQLDELIVKLINLLK